MLNLQKSAEVVLNLTKDQGIEGQKAKVIFVADYSQSMGETYRKGTVQCIMERLVPIAMTFDPSRELEMWLFDDGYYKVPKLISESNVTGFVNEAIRGRTMGGTNYAPIIDALAKEYKPQGQPRTIASSNTIEVPSTSFFGKLFGMTKKQQVNSYQTLGSSGSIAPYPTLVIFITDGENQDTNAAIRAITEASKIPMFIQFVGVDNGTGCTFEFLKQLDEMEGRYIDNANFFEMTVRDLTQATDEDLYERILNEFGRIYVPLARSAQYRLIQ